MSARRFYAGISFLLAGGDVACEAILYLRSDKIINAF
jgi:hypothetical protein